VLHEWQTDALAAATANAALEGDETTFQAVTPTPRAQNRCQLSSKSVVIRHPGRCLQGPRAQPGTRLPGHEARQKSCGGANSDML
jgi:hypothetical protein